MKRVSHLQEVGESYTEHARHALWIARQCLVCVVALVVHAAYPNVLRKTASDRLEAIRAFRERRAANKAFDTFPRNCS